MFKCIFGHARGICFASFIQRPIEVDQSRMLPARFGVTKEVERFQKQKSSSKIAKLWCSAYDFAYWGKDLTHALQSC